MDDGSAFMGDTLIQAASMGAGHVCIGIHDLNKDGTDAEGTVRKAWACRITSESWGSLRWVIRRDIPARTNPGSQREGPLRAVRKQF